MKITFDIKNQIITRTDANRVISNSADYIEAEFSFSDDWNNFVKTANFVNGDVAISIPLSNNAILPSKHLNLGIGTWKVSVTGVLSEQKIETNSANVTVKSSGSIKQAGPTSDVYQDLLVIISELQTVAASDAVIRAAVEDYIEDNITIILSDATKEEILQQVLKSPQLADKLSLTPFAQVFPFNTDTEGYSVNGMCVAKKGSNEYVINCFVKSDDSAQVVKITKLDGTLIASKSFTTLGHANGCAYDPEKDLIYVTNTATSKTTVGVTALNWDLSVKKEYDLSSYRPYGVSVCDRYIYLACSGSTVKTFSKDFVELASVKLEKVMDASTVGQGLVVDSNFIYTQDGVHSSLFDGSRIMYEGICVYRHDGTFYKRIFVDTSLEVEAFDFYSGGILVACASLRRSSLFKSSIYQTANVFHTDTDRWVNNIVLSNNVQNVYVDETYMGFLVDGSETHPFSEFRFIPGYAWKYANTITINCLSNITYGISIKSASAKIVINGNNHNFAGLYFNDTREVTLNNMKIISASSSVSALAGFESTEEVNINNVEFSASATYSIFNSGCNIVVNNCSFKAEPSSYVLYERRGGTYRLLGTTQTSAVTKTSALFDSDNVFDATSFIPCVYGTTTGAAQSNTISLNGANHNGKDIFGFKLKASYNVPSTVSLLNVPTLESGSSIIGFSVEDSSTSYLKYTVSILDSSGNITEKVSYLKKSDGTHSNWN